MKEKDDNHAAILIPMLLIFMFVWLEINSLKVENLELKNDLNSLQAKVKIMDEVDDKIYTHIETLGNNDLMIESWIEEINCYLQQCRYEWSGQDGQRY